MARSLPRVEGAVLSLLSAHEPWPRPPRAARALGIGALTGNRFWSELHIDLANTVLPPSGRLQRGRRRSSSSLRPLERAALLVARAVLGFPQQLS